MTIKELIPSSIKLRIRLMQRFMKDSRSSLKFAHKKKMVVRLPYSISEIQPIKQSSYFQNKIDNIKLGASRIQLIIIKPDETLSFWKVICNPTKSNGFKIGRNLIDGKLKADYGGGLCQLSGIIYITALKAGLEIIERHNHTVDIYKEEERFTPLGADATVVYAYKDLRIKNIYPYPIQFMFVINNNSIECCLVSVKEIKEKQLEFVRAEQQGSITVETYVEGKLEDTSVYKRDNNISN